MNRNPEERLARLADHARRGWRLIQERPEARERARQWLAEHPSAWREVDVLWQECLDGEGLLAAWLAEGSEPGAWRGYPALHSVLASHPFPDLYSWSSRKTSAAS
jgi:hypothetical protein